MELASSRRAPSNPARFRKRVADFPPRRWWATCSSLPCCRNRIASCAGRGRGRLIREPQQVFINAVVEIDAGASIVVVFVAFYFGVLRRL